MQFAILFRVSGVLVVFWKMYSFYIGHIMVFLCRSVLQGTRQPTKFRVHVRDSYQGRPPQAGFSNKIINEFNVIPQAAIICRDTWVTL